MLSRVAERVYWAARYLERVENTARLINVYNSLLFDLPDDTGISWYNLVIASGQHHIFDQRHQNRDQRTVVKFLLSGEKNPSAMDNSLRSARENIRTTRDVVPPESWELVNELSLYVTKEMNKGLSRRHRREYLDHVIHACQQINGLIVGTMSNDAAWHMLRVGRNLERADMITRIVEAGATMLPEIIEDDNAHVADVIWASVLRSQSAYQPYRRTMKVAISGEDVVEFLLEDAQFPRSVRYCLRQMQLSCRNLPEHDRAEKALARVTRRLKKGCDYSDPFKALPDHINQLQKDISSLHGAFAETWFYVD